MHLVQVFLPLADNDGASFDRAEFAAVERRLTEQFGGVTGYPRAPASGLWQESPGSVQRDELVVYEVMAEPLDRAWWGAYRAELEAAFRQEQVLIRAHPIEVL